MTAHRDPPTRLVDDGYYVEPEPIDRPPLSQRGCVWIVILAACLAFWMLVGSGILATATPSSSPESTLPVDLSGQWSTPATSGAPHGLMVTDGDPTLPLPATANPRLISTRFTIPAASGDIGMALIGGWATYWDTCARCAAAGPLLRAALGPDWQGQTITVVSDHGEVDLRLVTSCACGPRQDQPTIIDVSVQAFNVLSPQPARSDFDPGYIAVSIEVGGSLMTLPPTDATDMEEPR